MDELLSLIFNLLEFNFRSLRMCELEPLYRLVEVLTFDLLGADQRLKL